MTMAIISFNFCSVSTSKNQSTSVASINSITVLGSHVSSTLVNCVISCSDAGKLVLKSTAQALAASSTACESLRSIKSTLNQAPKILRKAGSSMLYVLTSLISQIMVLPAYLLDTESQAPMYW